MMNVTLKFAGRRFLKLKNANGHQSAILFRQNSDLSGEYSLYFSEEFSHNFLCLLGRLPRLGRGISAGELFLASSSSSSPEKRLILDLVVTVVDTVVDG